MKKIISLLLGMLMLLSVLPASFAAASANDNARETTFDYPMPGDPNHMSDAEFFNRMINFDRYPELSAVKEAADRGDYESAKYELLEYYRGVQKDRNYPVYASSKAKLLWGQLLGMNVHISTRDSIVEVFEVGHDWTEVEIDVTSLLQGVRGNDAVCIMLGSISRTSEAEFMTKDGDFAPYITATVNDHGERFDVAQDTYVASGVYASTNFGSEPTMRVSEASADPYVFDENTKRSYMVFTFGTRLNSGVTVKGARLHLKGRIVPGTGTEGQKKQILAYKMSATTWNENEVVWGDKTFSYGTLLNMNDQDAWNFQRSGYSAEPMYLAEHINGQQLVAASGIWADMKGKNRDAAEQYAYTFLRQVMAQCQTGPTLPYTRHLERGLWLDYISRGAIETIDSESMTPDILCAILKQLYFVGDYVRTAGFAEKRTNNWVTFETGGIYCFISRFRELAIYDQWLAELQAENNRVSEILVREDMTSIEKPSCYFQTSISAFSILLTAYNSIKGADFPYDEKGMETFEKLFRGFAYSSAPGVRGFNDNDEANRYSTTYSSVIKNYYDTLLSYLPELEYFAYFGKNRGTPPDFTSISFPKGLYTVFRSDWSKDAVALKIDAKGTGTSHKHYSQLSVSMWGYDQFLITDQGVSSYEIQSEDLQAMKYADRHSMVVMNGKNLDTRNTGTESTQLAGELNSLFDFVSYASPFCVDAETQNRSVLFDRARKLFIVSDYIKPKSSTPNDYVQYWNMLPDAKMTMDEDTGVARSHFGGANVSVTPVAPEEFTQAELEHVYFSYGGTNLTDAKKAAYHKTVTGDVTYDTVIVPENISEKFSVETFPFDTGLPQGAANAFYFDLFDDNNANGAKNTAYYYNLNDLSLKGTEITLDRYTTDATTMYVVEDRNGKFASAFLLNASYLKDSTLPDGYVFKSDSEVPAISFRINGQTLEVRSSVLDSTDSNVLDGMTFYDYGKLKGASLNSSSKTAKKTSGGYLYFGDTPIIEGTPVKPDDGNDSSSSGNNTVSGPSHAGGGAGGNPGISAQEMPSGNTTIDPVVDNGDNLPSAIAAELANHWAKGEISDLYQAGIVTGDPALRLADHITRAEFITLITRALQLSGDGSALQFADVSAGDWYAAYIAAAVENGLAEGADGMFRPNDNITREEMCKILLSAYTLQNGEPALADSENTFADDGAISDWAKAYVYAAEAAGLVNGIGNNAFHPKGVTLREQAFVVLWRLLNK